MTNEQIYKQAYQSLLDHLRGTDGGEEVAREIDAEIQKLLKEEKRLPIHKTMEGNELKEYIFSITDTLERRRLIDENRELFVGGN